MNTQDESQDNVHNSAYNPFPVPQTIPTGWDTSVFFSAPQNEPVTDISTGSSTQENK
jgi:hypothetical protein